MLPPSLGLNLAYQFAAAEAVHGRHQFIEPEHFFIGVCKVGSLDEYIDWEHSQIPARFKEALESEIRAVVKLFEGAKLERTALYREVRRRKGKGTFRHTDQAIHRSPRAKQAFTRAEQLAVEVQSKNLDVARLLSALLEDPGEILTSALHARGVEPDTLRGETRFVTILPFEGPLEGEIRLVPRQGPPGPGGGPPGAPGEDATLGAGALQPPPPPLEPASALQEFGKDLTQLAREGKIHPPVGRKPEMAQVVQALSRQSKNCPVLLGEAGVGKTAVVEGLAWRIAQGTAPDVVKDARIIQLDMAGLLAGAKYRGEFEERLRNVLREAGSTPQIILFIDEIHTIMGAGSAGGPLDAANILKPALGRGEVRLIGATTRDEYRKHIDKDPALERRFEPILVAEPTETEALEILKGVRERLQQHHKVTILDEALQAAVTLSGKYLLERRLPDKAIDLIEKAWSRVAVPWVSKIPGEAAPVTPDVVSAAEVAQVVAQQTGIPVAQLTVEERKRLLHAADELKQRVVGQEEACAAVAQLVQRARSGLKAEGRPLGVLLFTGPTGVGKTELARATAALLFGSDRQLVRLDMSEFMERHTVARLVGAPPGYVGHDEEGQLTGALRRTPHCVVLLDEIEKAHPDALNLFLQVFDDGRLTDARGRTVDATNALFILTSNLPLESGLGLVPAAAGEARAREALLRHNLRPELVNRINRVIVFRPLGPRDFARICILLLEEVAGQLNKQNITLDWEPSVPEYLAALGRSDLFGARALRREIDQRVRDEIAARLVREEIRPGQRVSLSLQEGTLRFTTSAG